MGNYATIKTCLIALFTQVHKGLIIYLTLPYLCYKMYKESGFLQTIYVCSAFKNISRNVIERQFASMIPKVYET